jgi:hypothetical protein
MGPYLHPKISQLTGVMWGFIKFAAAVAVILSLFYWVVSEKSKREIQPSTPEYAAYINGLVANCVSDRLAENLKRNRIELPVLPSRAEVETSCRAAVDHVDRLYPRPERP